LLSIWCLLWSELLPAPFAVSSRISCLSLPSHLRLPPPPRSLSQSHTPHHSWHVGSRVARSHSFILSYAVNYQHRQQYASICTVPHKQAWRSADARTASPGRNNETYRLLETNNLAICTTVCARSRGRSVSPYALGALDKSPTGPPQPFVTLTSSSLLSNPLLFFH
jgi:hypothetical protein